MIIVISEAYYYQLQSFISLLFLKEVRDLP